MGYQANVVELDRLDGKVVLQVYVSLLVRPLRQDETCVNIPSGLHEWADLRDLPPALKCYEYFGVLGAVALFALRGKDPLFAAFDGANCPDAVSSTVSPSVIGDPNNPHSLLLNKALIRIRLPWPPKGVTPEFTIAGVYDPTHCELSPKYGVSSAQPTISVYRRSSRAANLKYVTTVGPGTTAPGTVLPVDVYGQAESGNIMYDGREATLQSQAVDAIVGHTQGAVVPSTAVIQQIVDFENGI